VTFHEAALRSRERNGDEVALAIPAPYRA
jgi:hypothetical protein